MEILKELTPQEGRPRVRALLSDGTERKGYTHRLVWIDTYGDIPPGMVIHHLNEDVLDNRLENLKLMSLPEHVSLHQTGRVRTEEYLRQASISRKGKPGKKHTEESKQKMRENFKGKGVGRKRPECEKEQISASLLAFYSKKKEKRD